MIKYGSSPAVWRTSTIKDNENPKWDNETHDYILEDQNQVISVDVWYVQYTHSSIIIQSLHACSGFKVIIALIGNPRLIFFY